MVENLVVEHLVRKPRQVPVGVLVWVDKSGQSTVHRVNKLATEKGQQFQGRVKASFEMRYRSQPLRVSVSREGKAEGFHDVVLRCRVIEGRQKHGLGQSRDPSVFALFAIHVAGFGGGLAYGLLADC